jgi:hypothetical protein
MSNTLNLGNGNWATKEDSLLGYNSENGNFKPLPFDFTRASSATVVNKDGLIETVGSGEPRIDFKDNTKGALLLEPQRLQKIQYSEDIESWSTTGVITKENNVSISPDGTLNAGTITSNASNFDRITQTISVSANSTYTGSLFIKKVQSQTNYMGIGFIFTGGTTDVGYVIFDAVNGIAVSADARIDVISEVKDFGDYWRLQSTATDNGSNTSLQFNIYATLSTNGTTTGLGISSPRTIWGIQLEQGSYATSYIPTSGQSGGVTRVADNAYQQNVTQVIGQSEGTMFIEFTPKDSSTLQILYQAKSSSGVVGQVDIRLQGGLIRALANDGGGSQFFMNGGSYTVGTKYKVAVRYKLNDSKLYINGTDTASDTTCSFTSSSLDQVSFADSLSSFLPSVDIVDSRLYNTALTDAELEKLTSWTSFTDMANGQLYSIK